MNNVVLNIPHASINGIYDRELSGWETNPHFINDCVSRWTDWYTDFLFHSDNYNVTSIIFPYSRFVCDAERLEIDEMDAIGQGIAYREFDGYKRDLTEERERKVKQLWVEHQQKLRDCLNKDSVLIDCHSFPSDMHECDICIGYNDDWSFDPYIVNGIKREFEKSGYKVALNAPYTNSITPKTDFQYKSVMIEVNKRLYMDEKRFTINRNQRQWMRWFGTLNRVFDFVVSE